jgi:hypothetical protein
LQVRSAQQHTTKHERESALKRIIGFMFGSIACTHIFSCAWHYMGERHKDWQINAPQISWLHVEEPLADITYSRTLWGMQEAATAWERYILLSCFCSEATLDVPKVSLTVIASIL